jgi:hypothetical protein
MKCPWCNTDPEEAAAHHEGPHLTWCVHFRHPLLGQKMLVEFDRISPKPDFDNTSATRLRDNITKD